MRDAIGPRSSLLCALLAANFAAAAAPHALGPALSGDGDGLNSFWVRTAPGTPVDIQSTLAALAVASPQNPRAFVIPYVDVRDFEVDTGGEFNSPDLADPYTTVTNGQSADDPAFAVRFHGFLNVVTAGDYQFRVLSDDGFRLTIGDEIVSLHDGNRSPAITDSNVITLTEGLYALELLGWEQGGQFVNEFSWRLGSGDFAVIGTAAGGKALFTTAPVPLPATLPLLFGAVGGLGWRMRRA